MMAPTDTCQSVHDVTSLACTLAFAHDGDHVHAAPSFSVQWKDRSGEVLAELQALLDAAPLGPFVPMVAAQSDFWTGEIEVTRREEGAVRTHITCANLSMTHVLRYLCAAGTHLPGLLSDLGRTRASLAAAKKGWAKDESDVRLLRQFLDIALLLLAAAKGRPPRGYRERLAEHGVGPFEGDAETWATGARAWLDRTRGEK